MLYKNDNWCKPPLSTASIAMVISIIIDSIDMIRAIGSIINNIIIGIISIIASGLLSMESFAC